MRSARFEATEIDGDDAAWLRGQLPPGAEIIERAEVDFWGRTFVESPSGLLIPDAGDGPERFMRERLRAAEAATPRPIGVDLFCGAGGFSLGLHEAGFDVLAAAEWDPDAARTYLLNLGAPGCRIHHVGEGARGRWDKAAARARKRGASGEPADWIGSAYLASRGERERGCSDFFFGDVAQLTGTAITDAIGTDHVAVVFGGPPCQGLSTASSKACIEDPRNALLWEFLRLVDEIHPDSFIIENVPTLLTVAKGALFEALCRRANESSYNVVANVVDASNYGVPQRRRRALIVGTREGRPTYQFPIPTTWAHGRRVDGRRWSMGAEVEEEAAAAEFDAETRTWSAPEGEPVAAAAAGQEDLFG